MGVVGAVFAVVFGIFWTILAFAITGGIREHAGPGGADLPFSLFGYIFPLFGVFFVVIGIVQVFYNLRNAVGKNRLSVVDITEPGEEPDPLNLRYGGAELVRKPEAEDAADRLQELSTLRAQGLISDAEYTAQRARIIGEI